MLNLKISSFQHSSGYRKTFNSICFCCFMVCTCDRRIRRTAHQLIELDGRHSKSLNLMVCPPNRGIPRSVLQISSCSSSITISSTSINVRSKRTSRNSTFIFSRLHRKETSRSTQLCQHPRGITFRTTARKKLEAPHASVSQVLTATRAASKGTTLAQRTIQG